jgi:hypothetical protein
MYDATSNAEFSIFPLVGQEEEAALDVVGLLSSNVSIVGNLVRNLIGTTRLAISLADTIWQLC